MEIANGIWVVENFFTEVECKEWIDFAEKIGFDDAPISAGIGKEVMRKDIRNNSRAMVDDDEKAFLLWQRAKEHVPKMMYGRVCAWVKRKTTFLSL